MTKFSHLPFAYTVLSAVLICLGIVSASNVAQAIEQHQDAETFVIPEHMKIQPGDVDKAIYVADSASLGPARALFMKLKPTEQLGVYELSHFYWNGRVNKMLEGGLGYDNVETTNKTRMMVDAATGWIYVGGRRLGIIHRVQTTVVVYFGAPFNIDVPNGKITY